MKDIDALTYDELLRLAYKIYINKARMSRKLFPEQPEGHMEATGLIQEYCFITAVARRLRREGAIVQAIEYENIVEKTYDKLPHFAKW